METMSGVLSIITLVFIVLGGVLGILWLILPFILIRKLNNIEDAVRTFHSDLAQFLNDYASKALHR